MWNPHLKKQTEKTETVQRVVTRREPSLRNLSYEERLEQLWLPNLYEREKKRGDMIMLDKCVTGKEKTDVEKYENSQKKR